MIRWEIGRLPARPKIQSGILERWSWWVLKDGLPRESRMVGGQLISLRISSLSYPLCLQTVLHTPPHQGVPWVIALGPLMPCQAASLQRQRTRFPHRASQSPDEVFQPPPCLATWSSSLPIAQRSGCTRLPSAACEWHP
eukprot:scaffold1074_cov192-Pinguiococcus_pyrenoidosus.AAC.6